MEAFRPSGTGWLVRFEADEGALLEQIFTEVVAVLDAPILPAAYFTDFESETEPLRGAPDNPVLVELLPPMSEDESFAAEMRNLTEDTLRQEKTERLVRLSKRLHEVGQGGYLEIPYGEEWDWLIGFNDARIALAASLGIDSDEAARKVEAVGLIQFGVDLKQVGFAAEISATSTDKLPDPRGSALYLALGWWQDSLLCLVHEARWAR